jgi:hypothetical protein
MSSSNYTDTDSSNHLVDEYHNREANRWYVNKTGINEMIELFEAKKNKLSESGEDLNDQQNEFLTNLKEIRETSLTFLSGQPQRSPQIQQSKKHHKLLIFVRKGSSLPHSFWGV